MATSVSRSRAALLCFGGWGLQTMLHMWPRLQLIQEQRDALDQGGQLADLSRLTAFATIMPKPLVLVDEETAGPLSVFRPVADRPPRPFYLERVLKEAIPSTPATSIAGRTYAELTGASLLQRVREDGYVAPLPLRFLAGAEQASNVSSRAGMFSSAIGAAEATVRALINQVIDPTRYDSTQTGDPFVQTTIYVVASLAEPLASALIWPIISELVATLRTSHIAKVVGLLSTGSFAPDASRVVEEATAHAALSELEGLSGAGDHATANLQALVEGAGGPGWSRRVGQRLFDTIYLIDREKSNQALAQNSYELTMLVGNSLETFLVADGISQLERNLGPDYASTREAPYSVLGAASDYVPIAEYLALAVEAEQKQVARSEILMSHDEALGKLSEIEATGDQAVALFRAAGTVGLFDLATDGRRSSWPRMPSISAEYLLPDSLVRQRGAKQHMGRWHSLLEAREQVVNGEISKHEAKALAAWGLTPDSDSQADESEPLPFLQNAISLARRRLVADICWSPNGILQAHARVSGWVQETEAILRQLDAVPPPRDLTGHYRRSIATWLQELETIQRRRNRSERWAGASLAAVVVLVIVFWLLQQQDFALNLAQRVVIVASGLALLILIFGAVWFSLVQPLQYLRQQRLGLAQAWLSRRAQQLLHQGLFTIYRRLYAELVTLQHALQQAVEDLARWAGSDESPNLSPISMHTHLRMAYADDHVWTRVKQGVGKSSQQGKRTAEEFRQLWRARASWEVAEDLLSQRVRTALAGRSSDERAKALVRIYREYLAKTTSYLGNDDRLMASHPEVVRQVAISCHIERLLRDVARVSPADLGNGGQLAYVENLQARAKPSANYEVSSPSSPYMIELEFGVTPSGADSRLQPAFERSYVPLLTSGDPFSISLVRTVNRLARHELSLAARCGREFRRLHPLDREMITLLPGNEMGEPDPLYGQVDQDLVMYQQLITLPEVKSAQPDAQSL